MKKKILIPLLLIWILTSCTKDATPVTTNQKDSNTTEVDTSVIKKETSLTVSERCIWCWKCIRIAPENFKLNVETYKAEVISQNNINSTKIDNAIRSCPVKAISREEI